MNNAFYLKDVQGLSSDTSLFTAINAYNTIFPTDIFSNAELQSKAEEYFYHSGDKPLAKIARKWNEDAVNLSAFITKIVVAVVSRFGFNWQKLIDAYFVKEYNPIENYDMEEKRTPDLKETTNTKTDFKTEQDVTQSLYGFNSTTPVDVNKTESNTSGTRLNNVQDIEKTNTGTDTLTRHGNIGVVTSAQLVTGELELRKYDFWEQVFRDIDKIICQQVY